MTCMLRPKLTVWPGKLILSKKYYGYDWYGRPYKRSLKHHCCYRKEGSERIHFIQMRCKRYNWCVFEMGTRNSEHIGKIRPFHTQQRGWWLAPKACEAKNKSDLLLKKRSTQIWHLYTSVKVLNLGASRWRFSKGRLLLPSVCYRSPRHLQLNH